MNGRTLLSPSSGSRLTEGILINEGVAMAFHIHGLYLHPAGLVVHVGTTEDLDSKFFHMNSS